MGRLEGKVVVLTGGAGGIGRAVGKRFVAEGADVLLVDLDEQALAAACAEMSSNKVSYCVADVTKAADNVTMIETATERYGGVDAFIANGNKNKPITPENVLAIFPRLIMTHIADLTKENRHVSIIAIRRLFNFMRLFHMLVK